MDVAILSYVITGFGCLGILAGIAFLVGTIRFLRSAEPAAATVVEYETRVSRDSEGGSVQLLHPIVQFEDRDGRTQRVTMHCGSSGAPPFPTGSRVEVLFLPNDPSGARIRSFSHLWLFPVVFLAAGLFGMAFGLAVRAVSGAES